MNHESSPALFSRRQLFAAGGGSVLLAAFLAACGDTTTTTAPGVLGNAPAPADLPPISPDRHVYLRTLASIELSIAEAYRRLADDVDLADEPDVAAALERFTADHEAAADEFNEFVTSDGGEAFGCPNPWYDARFIGPLLTRIAGGEGVEPSDNPLRDLRNVVYALESWESASIHQLLGELGQPVAAARLAVAGSRRAAVMALLANPPAQNGFVSPVLDGDEPPVDADNVVVPFALNAVFGQLIPVNVAVGSPDEHGARFSAALATPGDNSFIAADAACDA